MGIVIAMLIRENGMCSIKAYSAGMSRTICTGEHRSRSLAEWCTLDVHVGGVWNRKELYRRLAAGVKSERSGVKATIGITRLLQSYDSSGTLSTMYSQINERPPGRACAQMSMPKRGKPMTLCNNPKINA
jgi:hypothetical protein